MVKMIIEQSFENVKKDIDRLERGMLIIGFIFLAIIFSMICMTICLGIMLKHLSLI